MSTNKDDPKIKDALIAAEKARLENERNLAIQQYKEAAAYVRAAAQETGDKKFIDACEALIKKGETIIEEGQRGYDTWVAAMSAIVAIARLVADMNPGGHAVGAMMKKVFETVGFRTPKHYLDDKIAEGSVDKVAAVPPVPAMKYFPELTADGKLIVPSLTKNLRRDDGHALTAGLDEKSKASMERTIEKSMKDAIEAWLDTKGYKPDAAGKFISTDGRNTPLDKATFDNFRDRAMDQFVSKRFKLEMKQSPQEKDDLEPAAPPVGGPR